jgi:RNA polymerase-binding transcription factor
MTMDDERARALLDAARAETERSLRALTAARQGELIAEQEIGDAADRAESLTAEGVDDAVIAGLRDRLMAIERAERRLRDGSFGRSVRSGTPIPDSRLEADPTAELTLEEAEARQ